MGQGWTRGETGEAVVGVRPHKTKIVATIGPASSAVGVMEALMRAGMDIARLNFSHGTFEEHAQRIVDLREAARRSGREVAILADLPGPKIRLGAIAPHTLDLVAGDAFTLTTEDVVGGRARASVSYPALPQVLSAGDVVYMNDGLVRLEVEAVAGCEVRCRVVVGGPIASRKGLNVPGVDLGTAAFTEHDRRCLEFALAQGVDAVSQSFVESAADVERVRSAAAAQGYRPFVLAKIERARALDHVDAIVAASDGLMIARGDLGVEVPIEQIALLQKTLVAKARAAGKPVITATQMLESMTHGLRPTRAEATDVSNAILDGTDAVMLSAESATGAYPVEAVGMLARIAAAVEPHRGRDEPRAVEEGGDLGDEGDLAEVASAAVVAVLRAGRAAAVIVPSETGRTAGRLARYRLPVWIVAGTEDLAVVRRALFFYGVHSLRVTAAQADWAQVARDWVRAQAQGGDFVVVARGPSGQTPSRSHSIELVDLADEGVGIVRP